MFIANKVLVAVNMFFPDEVLPAGPGEKDGAVNSFSAGGSTLPDGTFVVADNVPASSMNSCGMENSDTRACFKTLWRL